MYQKSISISLVLFTSGVVYASPNLQIHGLIDQGIQINHNTSDDANVILQESNKMSSRLGIKGREDIAPKQSIFFHFEGDTKPSKHSEGTFFSRRRQIGYEHLDYGQVSLGLQSSASFDVVRVFDPSGLIRQKYVIDDLSGTLNGRHGNKWINNSLKYSYHSKDTSVIASYQPRAAEGYSPENYAIGSSHRLGNTTIAGSITYNEEDSNIWNAGLAHPMGSTTFKIAYAQSQLQNRGPITKIQNLGVGIKHQIQQHSDVFAAYYQQINHLTNNKIIGDKYVVGGNYHLSKRTHLYGYIHHASGAHQGKPIPEQSGMTIGVVHRF
jgi:predicted porin